MLTVQDIKKRKFSKKLRGYDVEEVNKFVEDILVFITYLKKELNKNETKISLKENELKKSEESITELTNKAYEIENAINKQDEVNTSLNEEKSIMFKKLEKYSTQMEILKRENSDLEAVNKRLEDELKTLNEESNSLKESIKNLQVDVEEYSLENKEYEQKIKVCIEREDSIKEVMFLAKKTGDEIIEKAEIEAKNIVINAEAHEALLLKKIKTLENIVMNMKKDFSEIVNYHATVFESEISKIKSVTDE